MTDIYSIPLHRLDGTPTTLAEYRDQTLLIVNVASKCGLTPQYAKLEELQRTYAERGFTVLGFPCNQFLGQEPGGAEQIQAFCSVTYGVTFPMFEKLKVNGRDRHPLYKVLTEVPDDNGKAGRVQWNFEKFLITPPAADDADAAPGIRRFRPRTEPDAPQITEAIEASLAGR
ncbi:glutathione peroxidase [Pseudoclavibacter sp. CFCC 14310]|uniref:glutathione peroxidase n=1 Tax=Pseudoclavibacter sp. CFCC 14310 TaxID=2615180 RepID=UPI001301652E|nr:glutathione peroxidase [Pseudoclavibacter sp. CFCC 14310]KAB1644512.1 glutathione peroxidase [Pseudoclavibacter sp. CFCC 14310]